MKADLGKIPVREIGKALGKTERMNLLVTPQQKNETRTAARQYGLSMTDHPLRLHTLLESWTLQKRR